MYNYFAGGVYSTFGGHDASRGLATFSVSGKDEYDDLSDLNSLELESMLEWETQFLGKYCSTYIAVMCNIIIVQKLTKYYFGYLKKIIINLTMFAHFILRE